MGSDKQLLERLNGLVDPKVGIIKYIYQVENNPTDANIFNFATEVADARVFSGKENYKNNGGAALNPVSAKIGAIGESIERYCSSVYSEKDFIRSSYSSLKERALNPAQVELFSRNQYERHLVPFQPFTKETVVDWVMGRSLFDNQPVLVPASLAYVPYFPRTRQELINISSSSGLAFSDSLARAILSGLYEVIERDAIMLMWYNRLSLPQVDLKKIVDPTLRNILDNNFYWSGDKMYSIDLTTEIGVPTFLTAIEGETKNGEGRVVVGAASRLSPSAALEKSLIEAAQTSNWARFLLTKNRGYEFRPDFSDIDSYHKHVLLYAREENFSRFSFVKSSFAKKQLAEYMDRSTGDYEANLKTCIDSLRGKISDLVCVDVTSPDIAEMGLYVVKVIANGLIPLGVGKFGNYWGIRRLYDVPAKMGYRVSGREEDLNTDPHPFP